MVERLRQEVRVYEVETISFGEVPTTMLGWWITARLASEFECDSGSTLYAPEDSSEEETGLS